MTDMPQQPADEPNVAADGSEQSYEWKGADTTSGAPGEEPGTEGRSGRAWLDQLQQMIDDIATQAAPVVRQIGVKAAELAAVAGEKAGPVAHRAAEATETGGIRLAERARQLADDLRRQQASEGGETPPPTHDAAGSDPAAADEADGA